MKKASNQRFGNLAQLRRIPTKLGQDIVRRYHYLRRPLHPLSRPLYYGVYWDDELVGVQGYCRPHFARLGGMFAPYCVAHQRTEPIAGVQPPYTTWQVLVHGRGWMADRLQNGSPTPRNLESWSIRRALRPYDGHHVPMLVADYLHSFPPRYPEQPWTIRAVLMWADLSVESVDWQGAVHHHTGGIYRAAGAEYVKTTSPKARTRHGKPEVAGGAKRMFAIHLPEPPTWWKEQYTRWWQEIRSPELPPKVLMPVAAQTELWPPATATILDRAA